MDALCRLRVRRGLGRSVGDALRSFLRLGIEGLGVRDG